MIDISVLIVVRNEERYIVDCIKSIETQFNEATKWELIIIDGQSTDSTKLLSNNYLASVKYNWSIIDNPKRTLAPGWNLGIRHSKGKYILRPDAHATLHSNYIEEGIITMENDLSVSAVGGILETKSNSFWGDIIKTALSSKIGVGNSSFRTAKSSGFADTAVYAIYRKEIFDKVGSFNENLVRHQDNEMHNRVKDVDGLFYLNINMIADYYCRDTIYSISKQMFNIGRYLPDVMFNGSLSVRHFIPFGFYLSVFLGLILGLISPIFTILTCIIFVLYLIVILIESIHKSIMSKSINKLLLIIIIPLIHLNYGMGTLWGLLALPFKSNSY